MSEKIYPKGLRTFKPNDNAPEFVKGKLIITMNELYTFCKENESLLTEYKGQKQLQCDILDGNNGLYLVVNDFKPQPRNETGLPESENVDSHVNDAPPPDESDLPF